MDKVHVRKGDTVMIMSGDNAGKSGKVIQVSPSEGKIIIEKQNMVTKHLKPKKAGDPAGLVKAESAIYACKVMPVCPHCHKPVRVGHVVNDQGVKTRICRQCKEAF